MAAQGGVLADETSSLPSSFHSDHPRGVVDVQEEDASLLALPSASGPRSPESLGARTSITSREGLQYNYSSTVVSPPPPRRLIFLILNPTSGNSAAESFLHAGLRYAELQLQNKMITQFTIVNIQEGESGKKPGFLTLRRTVRALASVESAEDIPIVVAGGDGTVNWCASELAAHGIDISKLSIGVVPYGTGNDFARALGWNKSSCMMKHPIANNFKELRTLAETWLTCPRVFHDIWEVELTLLPDGRFFKIDSTTRQKKVLCRVDASGSSFPLNSQSFKFSNYFSIGVEARIGLGFDRNRAKNRTLNKMRYGTEGVKKMVFKKTAKINQIVTQMTGREGSHGEEVIFSTSSSSSTSPLLAVCSSLVAINVPSFAAGLDPWRLAKGRSAFARPSDYQNVVKALQKVDQKMGDGLLEFFTFPGIMSMGLERASTVLGGNARRLHQGRGPFRIEFRPDITAEERVYFQVDGEFFVMTKPDYVKLRWCNRQQVLLHPSLAKSGVAVPRDATPTIS